MCSRIEDQLDTKLKQWGDGDDGGDGGYGWVWRDGPGSPDIAYSHKPLWNLLTGE
jgi:hypothetical protein